jgi:hypothetical protein
MGERQIWESNRIPGVCGAAKIDCSMPKQQRSTPSASNRVAFFPQMMSGTEYPEKFVLDFLMTETMRRWKIDAVGREHLVSDHAPALEPR